MTGAPAEVVGAGGEDAAALGQRETEGVVARQAQERAAAHVVGEGQLVEAETAGFVSAAVSSTYRVPLRPKKRTPVPDATSSPPLYAAKAFEGPPLVVKPVRLAERAPLETPIGDLPAQRAEVKRVTVDNERHGAKYQRRHEEQGNKTAPQRFSPGCAFRLFLTNGHAVL